MALKKRGGVLAVIFLAVVLELPLFAYAQPQASIQEAQPLELSAVAENDDTSALVDANRSTRFEAQPGETIRFACPQPAAGIYLEIDRPAAWTLADSGGQPLEGGTQGFLHEYLAFETPCADFSITFPEGASVCDVYALPPGKLPAWVQVWQPPCEEADLLLMPTHADDEHLWFGGALPYYAGERGLKVQVVYLIHHWGERYRPHELLDGLWTVGDTFYPVMGHFPDYYVEGLEQAKRRYSEEEVLAWQVEQLRRFQPKVVVGHDINGEYGHGAHCLNASTLLTALELATDKSQYPESASQYGVWNTSKAYLHLWQENEIILDWAAMPLEAFEGKTAFEMAEEGFAKHVSQQGVFHVRGEGGYYDCRRFGLVRSIVGPDVDKNDFFEHVSLTPVPTAAPLPSPSSTPRPDSESGPQPSPSAELPWEEGIQATPWTTIAAVACLAVLLLAATKAARRLRRRRQK